jgi:hypothetical protein
MARKAAYRAITELSEWMEGQREKAEEALEAMKETQRRVWTPTEIYDACCPKWIAHGPELGLTTRQIQAGAASTGKGCNGGCGKEHPRIQLKWRNGKTLATLSHALDPLVKYMDNLCQRGTAVNEKPLVYAIDCFIQQFLDQWKTPLPAPRPKHGNEAASPTTQAVVAVNVASQNRHDETRSTFLTEIPVFGVHLVKVPLTDQEASKRAQWKHSGRVQQRLEDEQRQVKRLRRQSQQQPIDHALFSQTLEVCVQTGLGQYLTIIDIAWMRLTANTTMAHVAARLAKARVQSVKLSYQVLQCESLPYIPDPFPEFGSREDLRTGRFYSHGATDRPVYRLCEDGGYSVCLMDFTSLGSSGTCDLVPMDNESCGDFISSSQVEDGIHYEIPIVHDRRLRSFMVRLFLDAESELGKTVEVARYRLSPDDLANAGIVTAVANVWYQVVGIPDFSASFHNSLRQTPRSSSLFIRNQPVPDDIPDNAREWKGYFSVQRLRFDFTDLLGIHVRHRLQETRNNLQVIRSQRPLTTGEREYVRALAREADRAPGTNSDWRGYDGWEWVA